MPQLPIPDDWNGDDWRCVQVFWPDSVKYNALLIGFLSYLTRGRAWDAKTGSITDVQAVGWDIYRRNWDLPLCEGGHSPNVPSPGDLPCDRGYDDIGCSEDCEDFMTCAITDFRCNNGVFEMFQCGKWLPVPICDGMFSGGNPPADDDPVVVEPDDDEQAADWRCSKATTIVDTLFSVAAAELEHKFAVLFVREVEQECGLDLSNWQLYNNQLFLLSSEVVQEDLSDALTDAHRDSLICKLFSRLDGSNNDLGANQWDIIGRELVSEYIGNPLEFTFMSGAKEAVGLQTMRALTRTGVLLTVGDCCADPGPELPANTTWAKDIDLRVSQYGGTLVGTDAVWTEGIGVVATLNGNFDNIAGWRKSRSSPASSSTLTFVHLEIPTWPIKADNGGVTSWVYQHPNIVNANPNFWARSEIEFECNEVVNQGEELQFVNGSIGSAVPEPSGGTSILRRIIIAGYGADPFPDIPNYE